MRFDVENDFIYNLINARPHHRIMTFCEFFIIDKQNLNLPDEEDSHILHASQICKF